MDKPKKSAMRVIDVDSTNVNCGDVGRALASYEGDMSEIAGDNPSGVPHLQPVSAQRQVDRTSHQAQYHADVAIGNEKHRAMPVVNIGANLQIDLAEAVRVAQRDREVADSAAKRDDVLCTECLLQLLVLEVLVRLTDNKVDVTEIFLSWGFLGDCNKRIEALQAGE